jgi:hypothetical protein
VRAALEESDARTALAQLVAYTAALLERAGDLIMVSVEAAGADPDMRAAVDAGAQATHRVQYEFAKALQQRGALRPGLDATSAADTLYALTSPHVHHLLRRQRRWSAAKYRRWLVETLTRDLLGE